MRKMPKLLFYKTTNQAVFFESVAVTVYLSKHIINVFKRAGKVGNSLARKGILQRCGWQREECNSVATLATTTMVRKSFSGPLLSHCSFTSRNKITCLFSLSLSLSLILKGLEIRSRAHVPVMYSSTTYLSRYVLWLFSIIIYDANFI